MGATIFQGNPSKSRRDSDSQGLDLSIVKTDNATSTLCKKKRFKILSFSDILCLYLIVGERKGNVRRESGT